jgi:hypothetical protein
MGAPILQDNDEIRRMTEAKAEAEREQFARDQDRSCDSRKVDPEALIERTTISDIGPALQEIAALPLESEREVFLKKLADKLKVKKSALEKDLKTLFCQSSRAVGQGIDDLDEADIIHTSIDFRDDTVFLGFRVTGMEEDLQLVIVSGPDGLGVSIDAAEIPYGQTTLKLNAKTTAPHLRDCWSMVELRKFTKNQAPPDGLFQAIVGRLKGFLDLQDEQAYHLLAAWSVGTYFAWAFSAFPFLHFFGPKETGKSKALEALRCLSFAGWKGRDLTAAALGDTVEGLRGTILLDQAEHLPEGMVGLLADSYKRSGGKRRVVEITSKGRSVQEFSTYGPKVFGSTKDLDPDLRDRCIRIPMVRTSRSLPDLEGWEPIWPELRDMMFRFVLTKWPAVRAAYSRTTGDGSRSTELWRPLQAVMEAMEVDDEAIEQTRKFFLAATAGTRHELNEWEERLIDVLLEKANDSSSPFEMTADEIIRGMDISGDKGPSPRWVGGILTQYSLYQEKSRPKKGRTRQTVFRFTPDHVQAIAKKYVREGVQNNVSTCPSNEKQNNIKLLEGTLANKETCPDVSPDSGIGGDTGGHVPEKDDRPNNLLDFIEDSEIGTQGHLKRENPQEEAFGIVSGTGTYSGNPHFDLTRMGDIEVF